MSKDILPQEYKTFLQNIKIRVQQAQINLKELEAKLKKITQT